MPPAWWATGPAVCHNRRMTVDEYLAAVSVTQRTAFERIDTIVAQLVPDVELTISYGIPTWKYKGKYVLYFAAYQTHMSVYPVSMDIVKNLKDKLGGFRITSGTMQSAGTVQFSEDNPVPEALIRAVVLGRLAAIEKK